MAANATNASAWLLRPFGTVPGMQADPQMCSAEGAAALCSQHAAAAERQQCRAVVLAAPPHALSATCCSCEHTPAGPLGPRRPWEPWCQPCFCTSH